MSNQDASRTSHSGPRYFYGYAIVAACFFVMTATMGVYFSIGVFFKPMLNEFGWTRAMTSGPISLSWAVAGITAIALGWLNDRIGPRIVVTVCGVFFGVGCILMSTVSYTWQLYVFYGVLIGIGTSIPVPVQSTVARWFVRRRTLMTGFLTASVGVGGLIVAPTATWMILAHGWRWSYAVLGSISLVVVVVAAQFLRRDPSQMNLSPFGVGQSDEKKSRVNAEGLTAGQAAKTGQFWLILVLFICLGFGFNSVLVHIVPHATDLGLSAAMAGGILAGINGTTTAARILLGGIGDKYGNKRAFMITFALLSLSALSLLVAGQAWALYAVAALFGVAWGIGVTQQSPLVASTFGLHAHGVIYGFICLGFTIGSASGPLLAGYLFDVTGSYQVPFLICGMAGIMGFVITSLLKPPRKPGQSPVVMET